MGAELGIPGFVSILAFYGIGCWRMATLARERTPVFDPWMHYIARMVLASIVGFLVAGAGVTVDQVETPYYVMALAAGALKLTSLNPVAAAEPSLCREEPEAYDEFASQQPACA
jgi:hypothetical protein